MSNSGFVCEKCNRIFKLKHHLKAHLGKQKKCIPNLVQNTKHECNFCNRLYNHKYNLNKHLKICKLKEKKDKNAEILKQLTNKANFLEIENKQLKDKMKLLEIENVRLKTENEHLKKYNELIDVVKKLTDENNN
jgi:K+/H+ antiporter YhaU regulatory subunit KhtT